MSTESVRPTKKQREILTYIEEFIGEHGYSPSYREIMNGLNYTSVATISLHVNNLIRRGHLRKRDRSARSLDVVHTSEEPKAAVNTVEPGQEKWLIDRVDNLFKHARSDGKRPEQVAGDLSVLVAALNILGLTEAASSFAPRLAELQKPTPPLDEMAEDDG